MKDRKEINAQLDRLVKQRDDLKTKISRLTPTISPTTEYWQAKEELNATQGKLTALYWVLEHSTVI